MKHINLLLIIYTNIIFAQSPDQNYLQTTYYKQATTSSLSNPTPNQAVVTVKYLDGFGNTVQSIGNSLSGTGKDLIQNYEYNSDGLITKKYLPFSTSGTSMLYDPNASTNASNFTLYSGQTAYEEIQYEKSPLKRVLKLASEGNDWDLPTSPSDDDHTERIEYSFNSATDQVKLFKVSATWNSSQGLYDISLTNASGTVFFSNNELYKTVRKNENWIIANGNDNTIHEFTDKEGNLILRRMFENNIPHDTYYVYDQFGNLTYIIPPAVTNTTTQMDGMCYQYKYDYRNRLVEKKLPSKDWQFIVYDKLNRPVATGPTYSPFSDSPVNQKGWLIKKYDAFNRSLYTGWQSATVTTATRKTMQDAQNNVTGTLNEIKTTSGTIDGISVYYSNTVSPTTFKLLTVNYYDNYNFPNSPTFPSSIEGQPTLNNVKGFLTGSWIRILTKLSSLDGETNTAYYDAKNRIIRQHKKNYLGGYTQKDYNLDFTGMPQYVITTHKRLNGDSELKTTDAFTYTPQGRLTTHTHQIGTGGTVELLSKNDYNEIGQLITKRVGNNDISGSACYQKIDYSYNIRGWLTQINNINNLSESGVPQDLFAFKINYNTVQNETGYAGKELYNGNISETYWRTSTDNVLRKYGYLYDNLHRLKNAIYQKPGLVSVVVNSYNENLSYDKNGNITKLKRNGNADGAAPAVEIDNLDYTYDPNSNKLLKVAETPTSQISGFKDGVNTDDDYNYDSNGNMILDKNKTITGIVYNHLNLPTKVEFSSGGKIEYIYDASGGKIKKIVTQGTTTSSDYLTSFQYKNSVLQFFGTSEGYVAKDASGYKYIYQYKDNLGNVRVSYAKNTTTGVLEIIEESHFYPFGLKHSGYNNTVLSSGNSDAQKYKYNDKEWQDELGLNMTAMDFRQYDNAIGKFVTVDAMAEYDNNISPYAFGRNNPVVFNDPTGLCPECEDYYDQLGYEPYGGEIFHSSGGAEYTFNEIAGEWDRTDLYNDLEEVVITNTVEKDDSWERDLAEIALDLTPVGDLKDIYQGAKNGDYVQLTLGIAFTTANILTLGSSSLVTGGIKGAIKAGGKELIEEGVEALGKEIAEESLESLAKKEVILVTKEGVALPKGAKIPEEFIENPFRSSSYGTMENGKFTEKLRIDIGTPEGFKGPKESHFHLDGGKEHIFDTSRWPWY